MKISIVMGIYNCEKYLVESIESILNQTYNNWELIMCDDGSIDNTFKIAKQYEKNFPGKIIVIKNKKNRGLNYTLNKCISLAKGKYIARQDGDDVSAPERFEKEIMFLETNKEYAFVSSNMIFFDEFGEWGNSNNKNEPQKIDFAFGSPFCHAPCMIRKEVVKEIKGYTVDKKLLRVEDYHLWFKIYDKGYKGYNIKEALYKMRDDRDAYKRRNFQNRLNETILKFKIFKKFKLPLKYSILVIRPIIVWILPEKIYTYLHKKKLSK